MGKQAPLQLRLASKKRERPIAFQAQRLFIAGWTARDKAAMQAHIDELAALGVTPPRKTPLFYRVAASRLTTAETIQVSGTASSGEAEVVLANINGTLWVGVGSDHTDREVETYNITVSKQMCDKPMAATLWPLAEVEAHWDSLELRSYAEIDGHRVLYQEGSLSAMLPPEELLARLKEEEPKGLQPGDMMMGGTLPALGGVRAASRFAFVLNDTVMDRGIGWDYAVETLPVVG